MAANRSRRVPRKPGVPRPQKAWLVFWLCLPSLAGVLIAWGATAWRVPTRVRLDLVTSRVSFTLRGDRDHRLLNHSVGFSELSIERCTTVDFHAAEFRRLDGGFGGLRPGGTARSGSIRLRCDDPDAKIAIDAGGDSSGLTGTLDAVRLGPGAEVALSASRLSTPVVTLHVSSNQELALPIQRDEFRIVGQLVGVEPDLGEAPSLATYFVRRHDAFKNLMVRTGRGAVLVFAPMPDVGDIFESGNRLPVDRLQFVEEGVDGEMKPAFTAPWTIGYPDYPAISPRSMPSDEFLVFERVTDMELHRLLLAQDGSGLGITVAGVIRDARIATRDAATGEALAADGSDLRLSVFDTIRHGPRWGMLAVVAAWLMATSWSAYERWKKLDQ